MVMLVELLPEGTVKIYFTDIGCPLQDLVHRFNIRIKTINYDG